MLTPARARSRPVENAERDREIIRWLAWGRLLKIVKHDLILAAHFGISKTRINQIKEEHSGSLLLKTAETSLKIRLIFSRMNPGQREGFLLPVGEFYLEKDR